MRRPDLGSVASYGTIVAVTTAEGAMQFLIPPYLKDLAYPVSLIGFLYALAFGVALVCRVPAGMLYRPRRARALVAAATGTVAAVALLYPLAPNALAFGALRTAHGAALALSTTVLLAHFLGTHGSGAMRGRALGYYAAALSMGYMTGNTWAGLVGSLWGAGVGIMSAALWSLGALALGLALPPLPAAAGTSPAPSGSRWASGRRALTDPGMLYTAIVAILLTMLFHVPGTFFPLYGLAVGLSLAQIGFIRAAFALTNTAVRGTSAFVLERIGRRQAQGAGMLCQAGALALVPVFDSFWPLLFCLLFAAFWRAVVLVANTVGLAEDVDPARVSRGVASGIFNAANDLGALITPSVGGLVASALGVDKVFLALPGSVVLAYFLATAVLGPRIRAPAPGGTAAPSTV